jgi:hypothetical protein
MVFQLKESVGTALIEARVRRCFAVSLSNIFAHQEKAACAKVMSAWTANPAIVVLGSTQAQRLPIISLLVRHFDADGWCSRSSHHHHHRHHYHRLTIVIVLKLAPRQGHGHVFEFNFRVVPSE